MAQAASEVRVYDTSQSRDTWAAMFRELWGARELTWRLLVRNFSVRYRQSILGILWALLPALATSVLFTYLRQQRVLSVRETSIEYPAYVLLGMVSWQVFQGGLTAAAESLAAAGHLVSRVSFPRESLVLASIGGTLPDAALRALLVGGVFAWYGITPCRASVFLPLIWLPLLLLVGGLGFVLSLCNALVRDATHALSLVLTLFFFLVPVVSPPSEHWPGTLITDLNPVASLVVAAHDVVVVGYLTRPASFAGSCVVSLLVFLAGWRAFRAAQPLIAERI